MFASGYTKFALLIICLYQVKQDLLVCEEQLNSSKLDNEKYKEKVGFLAAKIQQLESSQHDNAGLLANIKVCVISMFSDLNLSFNCKLGSKPILFQITLLKVGFEEWNFTS